MQLPMFSRTASVELTVVKARPAGLVTSQRCIKAIGLPRDSSVSPGPIRPHSQRSETGLARPSSRTRIDTGQTHPRDARVDDSITPEAAAGQGQRVRTGGAARALKVRRLRIAPLDPSPSRATCPQQAKGVAVRGPVAAPDAPANAMRDGVIALLSLKTQQHPQRQAIRGEYRLIRVNLRAT